MQNVDVDEYNRFIFSWGAKSYFKKIQGKAQNIILNQKDNVSYSFTQTSSVHLGGTYVSVPGVGYGKISGWKSSFDIVKAGKRVAQFSTPGRLRKIHDGDLVTLVYCTVPDTNGSDSKKNAYLYNHRTDKGEFLSESEDTLGIQLFSPDDVFTDMKFIAFLAIVGFIASLFSGQTMSIISDVFYFLTIMYGAYIGYKLLTNVRILKRRAILGQFMKMYIQELT